MQGFIFEGDLQFSKLFKMTFVPHTEFKGSPAYDTLNVFYNTSFKNYPSFSLQVPSVLYILLARNSRYGSRQLMIFHEILENSSEGQKIREKTIKISRAGHPIKVPIFHNR